MFKNNSKLKSIFIVGFLLSLHFALVSYINSSFLASLLSEKSVGWVFTISSLISVVVLLLIPKILLRLRGYKFMLLAVGLDALALLLLSRLHDIASVIVVFIIYSILNSVIVFLLDEFLQIFSKESSIGKMRGFYLTTVNLAWVFTQAIYGKVLSNSSFASLYCISFVIMAVVFLITLLFLNKMPEPKYDKITPLSSLKKFFKNKKLFRSYKINFLLQFFYAWMVIYTPIYLYAHLGFTWSEIGTIFAIMLLPFALIELPLGKYSDKIGERGPLILGFLVISLATASLFFIELHAVWIWALGLFATRVGAAIIEVMSDVYFFKHINSENDEFIGIYRNTGPMAYVIAPPLALAVLSFAPAFNYIFLVLGIVMLYGVYLSSTIRKADN